MSDTLRLYFSGDRAERLDLWEKVFQKVCVTGVTLSGVGKTFVSKRLAYSLMGVKDIDRVCMIQFHQSYSYEDFMMGFRPAATGFELRMVAFYEFCKRAERDSENDYFFYAAHRAIRSSIAGQFNSGSDRTGLIQDQDGR